MGTVERSLWCHDNGGKRTKEGEEGEYKLGTKNKIKNYKMTFPTNNDQQNMGQQSYCLGQFQQIRRAINLIKRTIATKDHIHSM